MRSIHSCRCCDTKSHSKASRCIRINSRGSSLAQGGSTTSPSWTPFCLQPATIKTLPAFSNALYCLHYRSWVCPAWHMCDKQEMFLKILFSQHVEYTYIYFKNSVCCLSHNLRVFASCWFILTKHTETCWTNQPPYMWNQTPFHAI